MSVVAASIYIPVKAAIAKNDKINLEIDSVLVLKDSNGNTIAKDSASNQCIDVTIGELNDTRPPTYESLGR